MLTLNCKKHQSSERNEMRALSVKRGKREFFEVKTFSQS